MSKPCSYCPFRSDREFWLHPDRRQEIADSLLHDGNFPCHETTTFDNEGRLTDRVKERFCVGAALFVENVTGSMLSNCSIRLSVMSKKLDYQNIDRRIPIFKSAEDFINGPS